MLPYIDIREDQIAHGKTILIDPCAAFQYGSSLTGASVDERQYCNVYVHGEQAPNDLAVKLIASFLLSYPLAGFLKRIPDAKPYQKNLFIIA